MIQILVIALLLLGNQSFAKSFSEMSLWEQAIGYSDPCRIPSDTTAWGETFDKTLTSTENSSEVENLTSKIEISESGRQARQKVDAYIASYEKSCSREFVHNLDPYYKIRKLDKYTFEVLEIYICESGLGWAPSDSIIARYFVNTANPSKTKGCVIEKNAPE